MSKKDKNCEKQHECRCEENSKEFVNNPDKSKDCQCQDDCQCQQECHCQETDETSELLSKRIKTLEDALLRSQAELQNYRKRKDEETQRIIKYAEEDILKGFLPILDNFERAIRMDDNNFGDETSKFLEGFRMVYNQTKSLLEKFEVKEIECLDKEFDPAVAQAVVVEKDENKAPGIVLEVLQKGYMYKDRVIRNAMVKVNESE